MMDSIRGGLLAFGLLVCLVIMALSAGSMLISLLNALSRF
jgi:hypothetical protein